jgi:hypothetical protein
MTPGEFAGLLKLAVSDDFAVEETGPIATDEPQPQPEQLFR